MNILFYIRRFHLLLIGCCCIELLSPSSDIPKVIKTLKYSQILYEKEEWTDLFDGKTTTGWHGYLSKAPIGWEVRAGILFTSGGNGDIVTDREFTDFELIVEWKIEAGGNSGIFYHVQENPQYPRMYETGPEFQIIDENNYPMELLEKQKTGACSDVLAPKVLKSNFPGNWNTTRIKVKKGKVEHWLNGYKVLQFSMNTSKWKKQVKLSKFADLDYAKVRGGKIGLQDHGNPVYFRTIRIREL